MLLGQGMRSMVASRIDVHSETISRLSVELGLSIKEIAAGLSVSGNEIEQWIEGGWQPSEEVRQRLEDLLSLNDHLHETIRPEGIPRWLRAPNRYIGSITKQSTTPAEAIAKGEFGWVEGALIVIDYGMFV
jgi:transcriptional regulator with XRE-family HTH domain